MKTRSKVKAILGGLAFILLMSKSAMVHADYTEEDVERTGTAVYQDITEEEKAKHEKEKQDAIKNGSDNPGEYDAGAKVHNENGNATPLPSIAPTSTDWENKKVTEEDLIVPAGTKDEVDRKEDTTPTPTPTPEPSPTPTPGIPKTGYPDEANNDTPDYEGDDWLYYLLGGTLLVGAGGTIKYFEETSKRR